VDGDGDGDVNVLSSARPGLGEAIVKALMLDLMDAVYTLCIALTTLCQRAKYLSLVSYSALWYSESGNRIDDEHCAAAVSLTGIHSACAIESSWLYSSRP
jgi:hypothetical protein